ncbi:STAS domain-containing protein [Streptomyces rochei]
MEVESTAEACVFTLRGELDFDSVVQLREAAREAFARPSQPALAVVDCAALTFCDSSGIGTLVHMFQRVSAGGGELRLAEVPPSVARVFRLTGLDQAIEVCDTLDDALAAGGGARTPPSGDTASPEGRRTEGSRR